MPNVALVETKRSKTNFIKEFDNKIQFDQFQLCSDPVSYTHLRAHET